MIRNAFYKIRLLMLGVFVSLSIGALAQVGGGSGVSAPPASQDPTFDSLTVTGIGTFNASVSGTTNAIVMTSGVPAIAWFEDDQATDEGWWKIRASGGDFRMSTADDSGTVGTPFFEVTRTANAVNTVEVNSMAIETGSFLTSTGGCSTEITNNTVKYVRIGNAVIVELDPNGSTCTSNSTAFSLITSTNGPSWWDPVIETGMSVVGGEFINNGASAVGICASLGVSGNIKFSRTCMGTDDWTNSGNKGFGSENKVFIFYLN